MAESVKVTVRIPADLAEMISSNFLDTGLFSSKADFITSAIRFYVEDSIRTFGYTDCMNRKAQELSEYFGKGDTRRIIQYVLINPDYLDWTSQFKMAKEPVLLRLPPQFVTKYERFIDETGFYRSKVDFFNVAIGAYLEFQSRFGAMSDNFYRFSSRKIRTPAKG